MPTQISKYKLPCSLALIAAAALLPSISHADVRYTMEMKMAGAKADADAGGPAMDGSMRTTTFLKDMREREETAMNFGPMKMTTTTITQCDKHQEIKLDSDLKIYTVSPIGSLMAGSLTPSESMRRHKADDQGAGGGTGKITMTFTAKELEKEKVADVMARHAMITFRTQSSGCAGNDDNTMKMELWMAPIKAGLNCPERYAESRVVPSAKGCQITQEMKGDMAGLRDMFGLMSVKQVFYDSKDKPLFTRELREHSTATLDDALFDVPSDYKKVTEDEFNKQQQQKMMNSFMKGDKAPKDDSDETTNETDTTDADAAAEAAKQAADQAIEAEKEKQKEKPKKKIRIPGLPF
ncbi:MAG: hypothetical protein JWQ02_4449 [Capsulimonas sp.]|nr:hypothetical protein [Capsulimonas sp.]